MFVSLALDTGVYTPATLRCKGKGAMAERTEHEPLGDWDPAPVLRLSMSISDPTSAWGGNVDVTTWFRSKSRSALNGRSVPFTQKTMSQRHRSSAEPRTEG